MFTKKNKKFYLNLLHKLIEKRKAEIFENDNSRINKIKLSLGRRLYQHPYSYGRILTIHYLYEDVIKTKEIFTKFRRDYNLSPDTYMKIYNKFSKEDQFLPKLLFYLNIEETGETVIGMEYIKGVTLRSLVLRKAILRRISDLSVIFFENGKKMQLFHASQGKKESRPIGELLNNIQKKLNSSNFFIESEKEVIYQNILRIKENIDFSQKLPVVNIHHDWTLRNILITRNDARLLVIDLDSVQWAPTWCWYDIVFFLINIESQIKYWPFLKIKDLALLWEQFLRGYCDNGKCEQITREELGRLLYLVKVDHLTDTYSIAGFYNRGLGKLYVKRLKEALLKGQYTLLSNENLNS